MQSTVNTQLQRWGDVLVSQRAGLRLYQWLWVLLCVVGVLTIATPRILSRPVVYHATATTQFDIERYSGLYQGNNPGQDFNIAVADATETLRQNALAEREVRFGLPNFRVDFVPQAPGTVTVRGIAPTAAEAQTLANEGAEELARQVHAAGGREILRNLLGWELWQALQPAGEPAQGQFDVLLRDILRLDAFPLSRSIEPVSTPRSIATLPREEVNDLARALESRYDLWRFSINTRNATLDAFCDTADVTNTAQREAALRSCATTDDITSRELVERDREIARFRAIESALSYVVNEQQATFDPDAVGAAYRVPATLPAAPEPRYIRPLLLLAATFGLAFGLVGVAIDRSAGVMAKLRDLWGYRELIRNLVLRDLRTRYKGSALGYLWTQLAPLLLMLVFAFVFGLLLPSGIGLYPVFIIVGLLPWNLTAEAVMAGTRSIIDNANLIKKVYFPREVLPLVSVCSTMVNYVLSLPMMFVVMAIVQLFYAPLREQGHLLNFSWTFAYLPVLILIHIIFLAGVTLFLGSLAVFFRDVTHLIGILVNLWFFLTPVIYSLNVFGDGIVVRLLRWFNPMASLIEFYREILYGSAVNVGQIPTPALPALPSVARVSITALLVLAFGYWFFQRNSERFGEEI